MFSGWNTMGWYPIEPGEEKTVYNSSALSNPNLYYCVTIEKCDQSFFGEHPLYLNIQKFFTIPNADKAVNYACPLMKPYQFNL